MPRINVGDLTL